jgi:hypothetical protein
MHLLDKFGIYTAIPTITQKALDYFETIKLAPFNNINNINRPISAGPIPLRRCPTRISNYIGKYSFEYHYNDMRIPSRIYVLDYGTDLYETPRGRRRLAREIKKEGACVHFTF